MNVKCAVFSVLCAGLAACRSVGDPNELVTVYGEGGRIVTVPRKDAPRRHFWTWKGWTPEEKAAWLQSAVIVGAAGQQLAQGYHQQAQIYAQQAEASRAGMQAAAAEEPLRLRHSYGQTWRDQNGETYRAQLHPYAVSPNGPVLRLDRGDGTRWRAKPKADGRTYELSED